MESVEGSLSHSGSSGFASFGSLGLIEDALDGPLEGPGKAANGHPPLSTTMFANFSQYGLWDITGDLFSSASGDSEVHHARQRSAEVLNLDGLNFNDGELAGGNASTQANKNKQKNGAGNERAGSRGASKGHARVHGVGQAQDPAQESPSATVQHSQISPAQLTNYGGLEGVVDAADKVKRTVYVADVHYLVSEQELARFFNQCGPLVDFRICGDTNTVLRFAFVEFHSVKSAKAALKLTGSMLGESAIRVSQSKTAIIPVKDQFLPRSERERDLVAKTVYVANIHPTVERDVLKQFFQMVCGPVSKIRLLGDAQHDTKIAFVEFASKDSTAAALRCTGAMLGPLAIRVSPSKTPVRTDARRRSGAVDQHVHIDAVTAAAKLSGQIRSSLSKQGDGTGRTPGGGGARDGGHVGNGHADRRGRPPKHFGASPEAHGQSQQRGGHGNGQSAANRGGKGPHQSSRKGNAASGKLGKLPDVGVAGASPTIMSLLESILSDEV